MTSFVRQVDAAPDSTHSKKFTGEKKTARVRKIYPAPSWCGWSSCARSPGCDCSVWSWPSRNRSTCWTTLATCRCVVTRPWLVWWTMACVSASGTPSWARSRTGSALSWCNEGCSATWAFAVSATRRTRWYSAKRPLRTTEDTATVKRN